MIRCWTIRCLTTGNLSHYWKEHKMLKTLESCVVLICVPAIAHPGVYPKEMKTFGHKRTGTKIFVASILIMPPNWKQSKCPSTEKYVRMYKQLFGHIFSGILLSNKDRSAHIWTNMEESQKVYVKVCERSQV